MQRIEQYSYQQQNERSGQLYLVGTPIGNLEDITYRAIRTLNEVDIIAAEDTRKTKKLLSYFKIRGKKLYSYHEHNKQTSGPEFVHMMQQGKQIALVSDAGLPAISDPGFDLVQLALQSLLPVIPIPGANAALSALIASGLKTDRFIFIGFLPREKKQSDRILATLTREVGTLIFYESPYRIKNTLQRFATVFGCKRQMTIARELTKRYEHFIRGTIEHCMNFVAQYPLRGECCLVVAGADKEEVMATMKEQAWWRSITEKEHVLSYEQQGIERKEAMKLVAQERGVSKRDIYRMLLQTDHT